MKIFSASQIKQWDLDTIQNEPIPSISLMERAARQVFHWFDKNIDKEIPITIFCGPGNNGGDGFALARMLWEINRKVSVYVLEGKTYSLDNKINQGKLPPKIEKTSINKKEDFPLLNVNTIVVDALYGIGLNKAVKGIDSLLIEHINKSESAVIAIDIPSGMYANEANAKDDKIIEAEITLTFELPKLSFFLAEQGEYIGKWMTLEIGLSSDFYFKETSHYQLITNELTNNLEVKRNKFSYKNQFGHAFLIAGSYGMVGAATLAAKACMRSGVGLTTAYVPSCAYAIMQISCPEVIVKTPSPFGDDQQPSFISYFPEDISSYSAIGIGPGLGKNKETAGALKKFIKQYHNPLVLDADALNILADEKETLNFIPENSILTPHFGEFTRLTEIAKNDYHRLELLKAFCKKYSVIVVLKGPHTAVCLANGEVFFNTTGNAGMATAGSGDVLTGIITALLAKGYEPKYAAILGVYKHGLSGDKAADQIGQEALIASDIIAQIR